MATLGSYVTALWDRQRIIAVKFGADIGRGQKEARVLNRSLLVLLATVVKTLVDKGVLTDAELLATLNTARDAAYSDEPTQPPQTVDDTAVIDET